MENIVTVIVPSYKRAHLLKRTIPTYIQEGVKELILVDDCSPDNTTEVVKELQKEYPNIRYVRQPQNMKQMAAKNKGLELATTEWVYFGDDDSILYNDSIKYLYETCMSYGVDACGACAAYMKRGQENYSIEEFVKECIPETNNLQEIIDLNRFYIDFGKAYAQPVEVPFCNACVLMKTEIARATKFANIFRGNAYREETDFLVRCAKKGVRYMYDSRAMQINLPPVLATGGSRSRLKLKYKYYMIKNTWIFFKRNYDFLQKKYNLKHNKYYAQCRYMAGFIIRPMKRLLHL